MKKCPFCAEEVQGEAIVCKHCGKDIDNRPAGDKEIKLKKVTLVSLLVFVVLASVGVSIFFSKLGGGYIPFLRPPTKTFIPTLTITPSPTSTFTVTPSITPTFTITPSPTQSLAFNSSFEDMRGTFEEMTDAKFAYYKDYGEIQAYRGKDYKREMTIYLFKAPGGGAAGFAFEYNWQAINNDYRKETMYQILEYYVSPKATMWYLTNLLTPQEEREPKIFSNNFGEIVMLIDENEEYIKWFVAAYDVQFLDLLENSHIGQ